MSGLRLFLSAILIVVVSATASAYSIQHGDQLTISLPGEASLNRTFQVDRQGQIQLPEIGPVKVAGQTEVSVTTFIRDKLGSVIRDLDHLSVYVSKRQLLISIQGYVNTPGEYTLPASASVQAAIVAAGGMRPGAQLNVMQLKRAGHTRTFNYKAFLDSGDQSLLPVLQSLDVIFVPASPMIGNIEQDFDPQNLADAGDAASDRGAVKVFGEVNHPGSFSHKDTANLVDLLMRAGGVTRYAGVEQIRVISNNEPVIFNLKQYLDTGQETLLPPIVPGATVFVPRQEEEVKRGANTIYIMGEVAKPGAYETKQGTSFMDILANAGGPTRFAESRQIRIITAKGDIKSFDLSGFTEGTSRRALPQVSPGDAIFIPEKTDMNEKSWLKVSPQRAVRIIGEVIRPGRIEWSSEMNLLDLLAHVGGPTSRADTARIEVMTPSAAGVNQTYTFNLDQFLKNSSRNSDLPPVRAGTTVRVHDLPQDPTDNKSQWVRQSSELSIYVFGQVGAPGRYRFTNRMHFLDILSAADGPTANADIHNIRITHRHGDTARVTKLNLALYFETGDENLLPKVTTGDAIYIPEKDRNWLEESKESTIRVLGAVNKPGRYRFNDNMTLLDLLAQAGGPSGNAYVEKITVVNLSCCRDQARTFDLTEFGRTGNFSLLPVIRAGDTVYIPDRSESTMEAFRRGMNDLFQFAATAALVGLL
ncbi:SLBB domain-containing protein [Photobacterium galatheae]|uniref:Sugar ABC transporter substrate-binding protein n=1 Tax=Photobacterium galatheae TaxID=1654360 RepID=A0A066S159_9GAMM|nr:SLBB domain-containing protein [Photobacterium galatheae]KDM93383.1 sugar ABC transporter substrate-binding protein [Photobacterium galatheae]MCM0146962.1 SLBB domain-containing protein [Photobacterium galatheae]